MADHKESDLLLTLLVLNKWSLMPELLDFFDGNPSRVLHFIDVFGGTTIKVPSRERVAATARNLHIWTALKKIEGVRADQHAQEVKRLAHLYRLTDRQVRGIRDAVALEMETFDQGGGVAVDEQEQE